MINKIKHFWRLYDEWVVFGAAFGAAFGFVISVSMLVGGWIY